jgi:CheY-like chemotaxis protein
LPGRPVPAPEHDVVVVNGDPAELLLLQHHFEGFRFQSAPNLEEGILLAEEIQAVALVADPPPGGLLPKSSIPIVHLPWPTRHQAAASLGAREILTKPVSSTQLLAAVNSLTGPNGRILIADSDPELVRLFQRMLRAQFPVQNCLEAFNAEEVADRAREEKPDLAIIELSLLQSGGGGRVGNISDYPALQEIPVILISEMNWEDLCLRMPGSIQVYRPDGFELGEVVQSANALFRVFGQGRQMEPGRSPAQAD